jgi:hypothetical protein
MRHLVVPAFVLAAGTAQAQSITPLDAARHGSTTSMVAKTCGDCPPPVDRADKEGGYKVPLLKDGVQSVAIMEIDGEKKIVRTEAWMGGSPVVYISKVPAWMTADHLQAHVETGNGGRVEAEIQTATDPIDFGARTGAVETSPSEVTGKTPAFEEFSLRH